MHTLTAIRLKYILPSQIFAECGEVTSLEIMLLHTWLPGSGVRWDKMKMIETSQMNSFIHMIWWTAHSWRFSVLEFIGFDTQTRGMCTSTQSLNQVCGLFRYCKVIGYNVAILVNSLLLKLVTLCIVSLHYWEVMNAADSTYNTPWSCRFLVMTHNYLITLSFEWLDKIQTWEIPATSNTHNLNPFNIIRYSQG